MQGSTLESYYFFPCKTKNYTSNYYFLYLIWFKKIFFWRAYRGGSTEI